MATPTVDRLVNGNIVMHDHKSADITDLTTTLDPRYLLLDQTTPQATTGTFTFPSVIATSYLKTPKIYPSADSTTAIQILKADGVTSVLNVDTTNARVGIGTTSPGAKLDINGNLRFTKESTRSISVENSSTANASGANLSITGANAASGNGSGGAIEITSGSAATTFQTGNGGAITLTTGNANTGNTGRAGKISLITGTSTDGSLDPVGIQLTVGATTRSNWDGLNISGVAGTGSVGGSGGSINWKGGVAGSTGTGGAVNIVSGIGGSTSGSSGALTLGTGTVTSGSFGTISLTQGANTRLFVNSSGNVGIGTTSPTRGLLEVNGRIAAGGGADGGDLLGIAGSSYTGGYQIWKDKTPTAAMNIGLAVPGGSVTNDFIISSHNGSLWAEKVRIQQSGNVGIGTTSPTNLLSLGGNSARIFWLERHTTANTAGNTLTITAGGATSGATDKNGGNLLLQGGLSTGTGESGVVLYGCVAGASGTTDRTQTPAFQTLGNKIGFFNVTPVVKATALTTADASALNTGDATSDTVIANMRTRINELESKLQSYGLLS